MITAEDLEKQAAEIDRQIKMAKNGWQDDEYERLKEMAQDWWRSPAGREAIKESYFDAIEREKENNMLRNRSGVWKHEQKFN